MEDNVDKREEDLKKNPKDHEEEMKKTELVENNEDILSPDTMPSREKNLKPVARESTRNSGIPPETLDCFIKRGRCQKHNIQKNLYNKQIVGEGKNWLCMDIFKTCEIFLQAADYSAGRHQKFS